jgi:spermidine synthase
VVIDDGRRFLDRTRETFDVITLDPPPPVEAAGSSMLYSRELYQAAKRRLAPGGILATWIPVASPTLIGPVTRAIRAEFPYVRTFGSIEGWGVHFLASQKPIPTRTATELASRVPAAARADMTEWLTTKSPPELYQNMLSAERDPAALSQIPLKLYTLTDDHPTNEYFAMRRLQYNVP